MQRPEPVSLPVRAARRDLYANAINEALIARPKDLMDNATPGANGLAAVVWSYPRGSDISKAGETGLDVVARSARPASAMAGERMRLPGLAELSGELFP